MTTHVPKILSQVNRKAAIAGFTVAPYAAIMFAHTGSRLLQRKAQIKSDAQPAPNTSMT